MIKVTFQENKIVSHKITHSIFPSPIPLNLIGTKQSVPF